MATLHPHDGLRNAGGGGDREAAHAAGDPGESGGVDTNGAERGGHHGGDQGGGRGRIGRNRPLVVGAAGEFGEQRWADGAAFVGPAVAVGAGPSAGGVHEESELEEEVELGVGGHSEAHLVSLALLVILAHEAPEGGAAFVLVKAGIVVVVEDEFTGEGGSTFGRAHATNGHSVDDILVAESDEVSGAGAEESHHHVAGDALLEAVRPAEDPGQAPGKAGV